MRADGAAWRTFADLSKTILLGNKGELHLPAIWAISHQKFDIKVTTARYKDDFAKIYG